MRTERRARKNYVCSDCEECITKGDIHYHVQDRHPIYEGGKQVRSEYIAKRVHLDCDDILLGTLKEKPEKRKNR